MQEATSEDRQRRDSRLQEGKATQMICQIRRPQAQRSRLPCCAFFTRWTTPRSKDREKDSRDILLGFHFGMGAPISRVCCRNYPNTMARASYASLMLVVPSSFNVLELRSWKLTSHCCPCSACCSSNELGTLTNVTIRLVSRRIKLGYVAP